MLLCVELQGIGAHMRGNNQQRPSEEICGELQEGIGVQMEEQKETLQRPSEEFCDELQEGIGAHMRNKKKRFKIF